jgi:hypothetical protein
VVHCPYCFGWELRGEPLGVLATGPHAARQALIWRQWSSDVALFLHTAPSPADEQWEQLAARGISVIDGEVTGIEVTGDRLSGVRLHTGQVIPRSALVIGPRFEARHALLDGLGVTVTEHPLGIGHQVQAESTGLTAAPGVWVAGNVADVTAGVMQSAASGVTAAAAINADLIAEDIAVAVAASRLCIEREGACWPMTARWRGTWVPLHSQYPHSIEVRDIDKDIERQQALARRIFEALKALRQWQLVYIDDMQQVIDSCNPEDSPAGPLAQLVCPTVSG